MFRKMIDAHLYSALLILRYGCDAIQFAFNALIIALIIMDKDARSRNYRKYICCVQISSLALDSFSDIYSPIMMMHLGIIYSESLMSKFLGVGKFMAIEFVLLGQVGIAYFACVYYRRGVVLGTKGRFNYTGRRKVVILLCFQAYFTTGVFEALYFMSRSAHSAEQSMPTELEWVTKNTSYLRLIPDENLLRAHCVFLGIGDSAALVIIAMLLQTVNEIKRGNAWASDTTRRYQLLAVRALVLQGTVPSLMYVNSSIVNICLQFAPVLFEIGETFNRIATVLSPLLWSIFTKHTLAGSLTILYFSPAYRKKILSRMTNSEVSTLRKHSETVRSTK